jgi:tRNA(fMet)-specific endonuclease VapC
MPPRYLLDTNTASYIIKSAAAKDYPTIRTTLERAGKPMRNLDMMIAAHALAADAILVTSDGVFRRVRNLELEDWSEP